MVYHVYDHVYYKVLTIVVCDMQSKDIKVQRLMRIKLNEMMFKNGFPKLNFKGLTTHKPIGAIKIIYGYGDLFVRMVDKGYTFLFHWSHSLEKHTKQLIKHELQDEHKALCHQYKNANHLWMLIIITLSFVPSGFLLWLLIRQVSTSLAIDLAFGIFESDNREVSWSI
jgi:hypothetical protein